MYPVLFHIGDWPVGSYGVLYLAAFLASIFTGAWLASRTGALSFSRVVDIAFSTAIGGEVGARLTFVIVEWERIRSGAITLKQFFFSGRVVLGGVAVGVMTIAWIVRRQRLPVFLFCDAALAGASLGMAIGRVGCLLAGCCYGKPTDAWWGITFTEPLALQFNGTPLGVALHPTQALQALDGFLLFAVLFWLFRRRRFDGQVAGLYWVIAGTTRFLLEFLRGDARGQVAGLATSQWIGLAGIAIGVLWLYWASRPGRRTLHAVKTL